MTTHYNGVPKKKKVYADKDGQLYSLGVKMGGAFTLTYASSGTIGAGGDVIVTGTVFKPTSVVYASYNEATAGTAPIAITVTTGSATFKGDASKKFFYVVIN